MLLPYSIKVVWFTLSFSGMLSCWAVLLALAKALQTYWSPILFAVGITILEGAFCLGMIWSMDPFLMPRKFCIAQSVLIAFSTFLLSGVCTACAIATRTLVLQPKSWASNAPRDALMWRPRYILPVVIFPFGASAIHIAMVIKYNATKPSNDFHCDASHPEWVRFFSYAGTPFLLSIPCFYLSVTSVVHILRTHRHLRRSRHPDSDIYNVTPFPVLGTHSKEHCGTPRAIPSPSLSVALSSRFPGREPLTPTLSSPVLSAGKFHLPFKRPALELDHLSSSSSVPDLESGDNSKTLGSPTFARPPSPPIFCEDGVMAEAAMDKGEFNINVQESMARVDIDDNPLRWSPVDEMHLSEPEPELRTENDVDALDLDKFGENHQRARRSPFDVLSRKVKRPLPPKIAPAIWRIIVFQMTFSTVQLLASISTIVDVARHSAEPTSFGTQHIALLLAAWGPVTVFGCLTGIWKHLNFWGS